MALFEIQVQCRPQHHFASLCTMLCSLDQMMATRAFLPCSHLTHSCRSRHKRKGKLPYPCQGEYGNLWWSLIMGWTPWLLDWDTACLFCDRTLCISGRLTCLLTWHMETFNISPVRCCTGRCCEHPSWMWEGRKGQIHDLQRWCLSYF